MLEFKTMETLKANTEILEIIKDYTYKVKKETIQKLWWVTIRNIGSNPISWKKSIISTKALIVNLSTKH